MQFTLLIKPVVGVHYSWREKINALARSEHSGLTIVSDLWQFVCEINFKVGLITVSCSDVGGRKSMCVYGHTHRDTYRPSGETSRQSWLENVGQKSSIAANIMLYELQSWLCEYVCLHNDLCELACLYAYWLWVLTHVLSFNLYVHVHFTHKRNNKDNGYREKV